MLLEAVEWLITPCPVTARRMGHLAESIAIRARARRCRAAWAPHLSRCQDALLASVDACRQRRIALVLGSGPLLDLPLAELSRRFEAVWLVDLVHPLAARWQARRYGNVRLIEHDVTECLGDLLHGQPLDPDRLAGRVPGRFLDEPRIDWVASLNLLSQLPNPARRWLRRHQPQLSKETIRAGTDALMGNHLAYLARFRAPVCLVSDLEQFTLAADGGIVEQTDLTSLLEGWRIDAEWRWAVAPQGELAAGGSAWHRVAALARI